MAWTAMKLEKHKCKILTLDGSYIKCDVVNLTHGLDLLKYVCNKIGVVESIFFGLTYKHHKDEKYSWLQTEKFLGHQLHDSIMYELELHVKFWPPTPYIIEQDMTRYQMVLELREKLLNGSLTTTIPNQALLASYLMQAEHGYFEDIENKDSYLNSVQFFPNQPVDFAVKIQEFYKKHKNLTPADAELLYLENARKILLHGMKLHYAMDVDKVQVILGINYEGINVIQNAVVLTKFLWSNIVKVQKDKKKTHLFIKLNAVTKTEYEKVDIGFTSPNALDLKRLFRACRDQLAFFKSFNPKEGSCDTEKHEPSNNPNKSYCKGQHGHEASRFTRTDSTQFMKNKKRGNTDDKIQDGSTVAHLEATKSDEKEGSFHVHQEDAPIEISEDVKVKTSGDDVVSEPSSKEHVDITAIHKPGDEVVSEASNIEEINIGTEETNTSVIACEIVAVEIEDEHGPIEVNCPEVVDDDIDVNQDDTDVDCDTVLVETQEVITEEVDPDTDDVVLVSYTTVTEIESSPGQIAVTIDTSETPKIVVDDEYMTTTSSTVIVTKTTAESIKTKAHSETFMVAEEASISQFDD